MSEKEAKKFRKLTRKTATKIAKGAVKESIFKIARQRDIIFIIALCEFAIIILLGLWILLGWRF